MRGLVEVRIHMLLLWILVTGLVSVQHGKSGFKRARKKYIQWQPVSKGRMAETMHSPGFPVFMSVFSVKQKKKWGFQWGDNDKRSGVEAVSIPAHFRALRVP